MGYSFQPIHKPIIGELAVPGDKSISHRAVILASIAKGTTNITNFLVGEDCLQTIQAFQELGVEITLDGTSIQVNGKGISGLVEPINPIYFGNSGTTARLMIGLLTGLPFFSSVYGDASLSNRPMNRIVQPLQEMGAIIEGRNNAQLLPLAIRGQQLAGIRYKLPVKSAQVKSALLLAGLTASGKTTIIEDIATRNHTENMLQAFGADIECSRDQISISAKNQLKGTNIFVPGDISSAAFFIVAAAIIPESEITLKQVGLNETRTGILHVLKKMGGWLSIDNEQVISGEAVGDVTIRYQPLQGTIIKGELIPKLIDELPIIALLATQAEGTTIIQDAEELKVKETNRIDATVNVLSELGATVKATGDGMIIEGKTPLHGGKVATYHDHRIAMMAVIASLIAKGSVELDDITSIQISYPQFLQDLEHVINGSLT